MNITRQEKCHSNIHCLSCLCMISFVRVSFCCVFEAFSILEVSNRLWRELRMDSCRRFRRRRLGSDLKPWLGFRTVKVRNVIANRSQFMRHSSKFEYGECRVEVWENTSVTQCFCLISSEYR